MLGRENVVIATVTMPKEPINVDPQDIYQDNASLAQSQADSAATAIKAAIANCKEDEKYIYKKQDNAVILFLKIQLPADFDVEKQEMCFGFQMLTESLRFSADPFRMITPVIVNCGKCVVKG